MKYPNTIMASRLVAEEMKLHHSRAGIKTLTWSVFMTIWLESLFAYFFFVSRSMDRVNLLYLLFLAAVFILYLAATVVVKEHMKKSGPCYRADMIFAAISYFTSAFSAYLFFSAAWRWHFQDTLAGGMREILRPAAGWIAACALLLLAGYACALFFEPKTDRLIFGNYYQPGLFLPLLPELVILLVSAAKQVDTQVALAKYFTAVTLAVLVGFSVRYAIKAALFKFTLFADADVQTGTFPGARQARITALEDGAETEPIQTGEAPAADAKAAPDGGGPVNTDTQREEAIAVPERTLAAFGVNADNNGASDKAPENKESADGAAQNASTEGATQASGEESEPDAAISAKIKTGATDGRNKLRRAAVGGKLLQALAALKKKSAPEEEEAPAADSANEDAAAADAENARKTETAPSESAAAAATEYEAGETVFDTATASDVTKKDEAAEPIPAAENGTVETTEPAPDAEDKAEAAKDATAEADDGATKAKAKVKGTAKAASTAASDAGSKKEQALRIIAAAQKRQKLRSMIPIAPRKKPEPQDENKTVFRADKKG